MTVTIPNPCTERIPDGKRNVRGVMVFLASDEWGNEKMDEVARQAFIDYPHADCVECREHAGWFLTYQRDMQIVGTANDACRVTPVMETFWRDVWTVNWLAIIRRQTWTQQAAAELRANIMAAAEAMPELEVACV